MSEEKVIEDVLVEEPPKTGWAKVWSIMKKYGLVGIIGTILVSAGTWAFTTIDNLKDDNIALTQQMIDHKAHREAMWMRLYYSMEQQQKLNVEIEVIKRLYNIMVYSKKVDSKDLHRLGLKSLSDDRINPKTYEDFKRESLMQFKSPEQKKVK